MKNPIAFALDVSSTEEADRYINLLEDHVGAFKLGLELFITSHKKAWWPDTKVPIVLDLKLHDIPETVSRAIKAGGDLGVKYMTLHIQQRKAMDMAVRAAESYGITLLGVTVLTSMDTADFLDLDYLAERPEARVARMARFGHGCGLRGFVCSPQDVDDLSRWFPGCFFLVPGIRPSGSLKDDQKRGLQIANVLTTAARFGQGPIQVRAEELHQILEHADKNLVEKIADIS